MVRAMVQGIAVAEPLAHQFAGAVENTRIFGLTAAIRPFISLREMPAQCLGQKGCRVKHAFLQIGLSLGGSFSTEPEPWTNVGIDDVREPDQASTPETMKARLMAAVEEDVAELCDAALDEATLEQPKFSKGRVSTIAAKRNQRTKVAIPERRQLGPVQPGGNMADQVCRLLVGDLRGRRQWPGVGGAGEGRAIAETR